MTDWLVLTASLPTSPSALRVRIWRALKGTGCASLRDGVYLLPATAASANDLRAIEKAIQGGGAEAHLLQLRARNATQEKTFRACFDRAAAYADFARALKDVRKGLKTVTEPELRKALRSLGAQLQSLHATDYFPGPAGTRAAAGLETLRTEIEATLSPGEPRSDAGAIEFESAQSFQGRTWATRKRPWVDRLATAWLVLRFVDAKARFLWLADAKKCPRRAIGFDFDGARFTHVGDKVTFEVMLQTFGFGDDAALKRLGEIVHYIDVGGIPADEAAGVEAVVRGLQARHANDDVLLVASCAVFDALYAALRLAN